MLAAGFRAPNPPRLYRWCRSSALTSQQVHSTPFYPWLKVSYYCWTSDRGNNEQWWACVLSETGPVLFAPIEMSNETRRSSPNDVTNIRKSRCGLWAEPPSSEQLKMYLASSAKDFHHCHAANRTKWLYKCTHTTTGITPVWRISSPFWTV